MNKTLLPVFGLALVCAMSLLVSCDRSASQSPDNLADDLDQINEDYAERNRRDLDEKGYIEPDASQANELATELRAAAGDAPPEQAAVLAESAFFAESVAALVQDFADHTNAFINSGGFDPATLGPNADYEARLALLDNLANANTRFTTELDTLLAEHPKRVRSLTSKGVDADVIEGYIEGFESNNAQFDLVREIRRTDADLCRHGRVYLEVLRDTAGHWSLGTLGMIEFDETVPEETADRFIAAAEGIQIAGNEQAELQRSQFGSP
ncbi:MAG: hypothetical protein DHS20C14_16750 [Phycisphaeraceae bacterium]|nr:MAG: hypothetical protein DHS20C14_16750 [Phycisphaeraceae bacterium]